MLKIMCLMRSVGLNSGGIAGHFSLKNLVLQVVDRLEQSSTLRGSAIVGRIVVCCGQKAAQEQNKSVRVVNDGR